MILYTDYIFRILLSLGLGFAIGLGVLGSCRVGSRCAEYCILDDEAKEIALYQ